MPILQTLQHKASISRLRKLSTISNKSLRDDAKATVTASSRTDANRHGANHTRSKSTGPEILVATSNDEHVPPMPTNMDSLRFWRKRAPSPAPSHMSTQSHQSQTSTASRDPQTKKGPASILRRRPSWRSSRAGSDDDHNGQGSIRFNGHPFRGKENNEYNPPPSAFASPQQQHPMQMQQQQMPQPPARVETSAAASASPRPPIAHRQSSTPSIRRKSVPSFAPPMLNPPGTPQTPTVSIPVTPTRTPSSLSSRTPNTPLSSTPSSFVSASSHVSASTASPGSTGKAFPGAVPESPAQHACRPTPVTMTSSRPSSRNLAQRSSRPSSSVGSSSINTMRTVVQPPRPASAMSNSSTRRRVSSRPSTRSTRSTRASIASISTIASSTNGHGGMTPPGPLSPVGTSRYDYFAAAQNGFASASSSKNNSPTYAGPNPFAFPPVEEHPSTPTANSPAAFGDDVPMFNVIPATPKGAEWEAPVVEPARTHSRRSSRSPCGALEDMPAVAEEEEEDIETPAGRLLNFDSDEFQKSSPRLNDSFQLSGSPIKLNLVHLDDVDSDAESDDEELRTAQVTPVAVAPPRPITPVQETPSYVVQSIPAPPPRRPKSIKRLTQTQSLYQAHDDGRSISHSLAELAALACDLPPLDDDMTQTANAAAARLAAARAAADSRDVGFDFSSARPVSAAPVLSTSALPSQPAPSAPSPVMADRKRKTIGGAPPQAPPPHCPLPPTPPFNSYGSLPSLMSHDSMPSSSSGCTWSMSSPPESERKLSSLATEVTFDGEVLSQHTGNAGLGLGLDMESSPTTPTMAKFTSPMIAVSDADADDVPIRPHRMSAMGAHPHRVALYGAPQLGRIREQRDSYSSVASTVRHTPHASISSSFSLMSEMSDDDVLNAQVVDMSAHAHPYVVGRQAARAHEVGVAY